MTVAAAPIPRAVPLAGHLPHLLHDPLRFLMQIGLGRDVADYRVGRAARSFVNRPDLLRELWQDGRYERTPETRKVLASVAGAGLLSQEGATHRRQRRLMQPAFHREPLSGYLELMVRHAEAALERWAGQEQIEVGAEMKRLALDIVSATLFGRERDEDVRRITGALEALLPTLDQSILLYGALPEATPVWFLGRNQARVQTVREGLGWLIARRRALGPSEPPDLLDLLLATRDEDGSALSDDDIAAQALTLLSAGFETTANTLTWLWWALAQHPQAQDKVRQELDAVLAGRAPSLADLPALRYGEAVVKETQRLYPAVWITSRVATEAVTLGGRRFGAGSTFTLSPYVTHRDPRYFSRPLDFWPERFLNETEPPKFAYLPFGAGVHQCIGNVFALWEMRVILAVVAARVRLQPAPEFQPRLKLAITLGMQPFPARLHWR